MLDAFLDWAVVLLPTLVSVVGVFVSLKAPHSKHRAALRIGLITFGVLLSGATFWQQSRSRHAHAVEVTALNTTVSAVRTDLATLGSQEKIEVARREQAEKDLMLGM